MSSLGDLSHPFSYFFQKSRAGYILEEHFFPEKEVKSAVL